MEIIRTGSTSKNSEAKKFFFENYILDEKINILKTAQSLKVSRQAIYNWINEMKKK
jgi:predicted transcriptional regulator YheO